MMMPDDPAFGEMILFRRRMLFRLFEVTGLNDIAQFVTLLVWAHSLSDALRAAEEHVNEAGEGKNRRLTDVTSVCQISSPDTDTSDYAIVAWTGGEKV